MNNVMNEVDSKQLFHKANKYQNPSLWLLKYETNQLVHRPERRNKYKIPNNYNDPSLSSPEASTHWLVRREREREDYKYHKYYEFYECRGFHNILVWNPRKLLEILGFTKDFTSEYWGFIANIEILEVNPIHNRNNSFENKIQF